MKAKTLKWDKESEYNYCSQAIFTKLIFIQYFIYKTNFKDSGKEIYEVEIQFINNRGQKIDIIEYKSLGEAKQAAQKHFNNFVVGLLENE